MSTLTRHAQPETMAPHLRLGRKGEDLAARHLAKLGFVVLSKNWRCREGELDVVATDGRTLLVCEVKTRAGTRFGDPAEAVTPEKIARIRRLTGQWLSAHRVGWCHIRFDVISILLPRDGEVRLRHIEGAF
ncbi:MAG TPA: YraN family protein [Amycolatopsis sp.]|uniref:YraN family protein n=1 Tax=Amycolatopsis sp. TaxID=37632 RepID=UPI002B46E615|nr:YraN family protein [Amycolatopsis sp.]HKS43942.1 YraN family protein [Amycolatopsis sp.]